jgi:acyl-CoA synthetase (AMP-forming)/AMP-acid ligase II
MGAPAPDWLPARDVDPELPALITHSSGSTGHAKAVYRTHRVLTAQHYALKSDFPPWPGQRDFPLFPNILLHNLAAGVVSVLPDVTWGSAGPLPTARLVQQLQREHIQTLTGNVWYFRALISHLQQHPTSLPAVVGIGVGGSPVPEPLLQQLQHLFSQAAVHVIYGSSEAEPIAVRQVNHQRFSPLAGYCVGSLHPSLECRIQPLGTLARGSATGQTVGEIQVRGPHVAAELGQWLRTGDYGYFCADGQLYLTGRQGNERLHQGVQHYQLEHLLYHLPGVERVAARADEAGFTVFVQGTTTRQDVEELLAKNFPASLCCAVVFRAQLPVDARHYSKILYDQLR